MYRKLAGRGSHCQSHRTKGRVRQGRGSGEPQLRESTNPGGMEGREGARESPTPVREGGGGRERARRSSNPRERGGRCRTKEQRGMHYTTVALNCQPELRELRRSSSCASDFSRERGSVLLSLPSANKRDHSEKARATKRPHQQSLPPNWFSNNLFGPQRGRPMSLQIKSNTTNN